ncbi:MAG: DUF2470 domain-containing protein [Alphaproteobacteria bacterium]|nr:DUF2470 domain-containing protein [Alphaproteobacteria bacterium]
MTETRDDPARLARRLIRGLDRASLATTHADADATRAGWPYVSLVIVAADHDASVLMLLSDLAQHTRNIRADGRAALLFDATAGLADPLTGSRLTVQGRIAATEAPAARARFLARHPEADAYAGFADFNLYRFVAERAHLVAGFGRIHWVEAAALRTDTAAAAALIAAEAAIVAHMNADHRDALDLYARQLHTRGSAGGAETGWTMTGIDADGLDLRRDGRSLRIDFDAAVHNPEAARLALAKLAQSARRAGV